MVRELLNLRGNFKMKTRTFDKATLKPGVPRELTEVEAATVSGGIAPIVTIAIGAAIGATQSAANAHSNGGNVVGAAVSGAISGALAGASGAVWVFSKVASVTLAGVSAAVGASSSYAVSISPRKMVHYL